MCREILRKKKQHALGLFSQKRSRVYAIIQYANYYTTGIIQAVTPEIATSFSDIWGVVQKKQKSNCYFSLVNSLNSLYIVGILTHEGLK